jgi:hypothetical protein
LAIALTCEDDLPLAFAPVWPIEAFACRADGP